MKHVLIVNPTRQMIEQAEESKTLVYLKMKDEKAQALLVNVDKNTYVVSDKLEINSGQTDGILLPEEAFKKD